MKKAWAMVSRAVQFRFTLFFNRQNWTGPIYLPSHIKNLLSQEAKDALQKYNVEAIQKFKASRNLNETQFTHTISEHAQDASPPIIN